MKGRSAALGEDDYFPHGDRRAGVGNLATVVPGHECREPWRDDESTPLLRLTNHLKGFLPVRALVVLVAQDAEVNGEEACAERRRDGDAGAPRRGQPRRD